jgi:hypothetical protein
VKVLGHDSFRLGDGGTVGRDDGPTGLCAFAPSALKGCSRGYRAPEAALDPKGSLDDHLD